jgi:hypothetical protein
MVVSQLVQLVYRFQTTKDQLLVQFSTVVLRLCIYTTEIAVSFLQIANILRELLSRRKETCSIHNPLAMITVAIPTQKHVRKLQQRKVYVDRTIVSNVRLSRLYHIL